MTIKTHSLVSFAKNLIVLGYYDGPTSGVGVDQAGVGFHFKMVAWDKEQWQRIFAVTPLSVEDVHALWSAYAAIEVSSVPVWVPKSDGMGKEKVQIELAISRIQSAVNCSTDWVAVESHDLIGESIVAQLSVSEAVRIFNVVNSDQILELRSPAILQKFLERLLGSDKQSDVF